MRNRIIRIRASGEELSKIRDLSRGRGLSISDMMRRAALGVRMPPRRLDRTHIILLTRTLGELGRIGGNVNQLVRRAHMGRLRGHDSELSRALSEINELRDHLRAVIA